jgi:hypothetical protein
MAKLRVCWDTTIASYLIELSQQGVDRFTVMYGQQIDNRLTYRDACAKLGEAILHALACEGKVENR